MALIRKQIEVEVKVGDEIKAPNSIFRDDLTLYVCHIEGDLLYIDTEKDTPKNACETAFVEDCYLV
jgi:adenine-specific DNA methylase